MKSFTHAFNGWKITFLRHPNLRIHVVIGGISLLAGIYFQITRIEWLILLFTIMWVLMSEMVNTAIESVCDLVSTEFRTTIKVAKDVSAGMVLLGATGAIIVGIVVFTPYIFNSLYS